MRLNTFGRARLAALAVAITSILIVLLFAVPPVQAQTVTTAPGATNHSIAPSMQRYMAKVDKQIAAKARKHPAAKAAAHGYEWPGNPWSSFGQPTPPHGLDCIDDAGRDDPPICASRTLDRYQGLPGCGIASNTWWGAFYLRGNGTSGYPGYAPGCPSSTYLHASVAEEVLGWETTGDYPSWTPLGQDCGARLGVYYQAFRVIATQYTTRTSNTAVRPVVYVAMNGNNAIQPYATACVYSTPGTLTFNGTDRNIGIPSGTPTFYGVTNWG